MKTKNWWFLSCDKGNCINRKLLKITLGHYMILKVPSSPSHSMIPRFCELTVGVQELLPVSSIVWLSKQTKQRAQSKSFVLKHYPNTSWTGSSGPRQLPWTACSMPNTCWWRTFLNTQPFRPLIPLPHILLLSPDRSALPLFSPLEGAPLSFICFGLNKPRDISHSPHILWTLPHTCSPFLDAIE